MTTTTQPTERTIAAGGTDVWVAERGSGPPVLLLAGLGDPHDVWGPQLDRLSDRWGVQRENGFAVWFEVQRDRLPFGDDRSPRAPRPA